MPPPSHRLSACIVNWNTRDDLRACLLSLRAHPFTGGEQEVLVVDNASGDGSAQMVREEFPEVRLIVNERNENFARGTNQALAAATGDFLLLLNPDVEVTSGALDTLVELPRLRLRETNLQPLVIRPVITAPKLVYPDGTVQASIRGYPTPSALIWEITGIARLFPNSRTFGAYRRKFFDYESAGPAPQPMASCLLIPRLAYELVGPMDEAFPLFFNDVDWCWRAWQGGLHIWYLPEAVCIHKGGATTGKVRKAAVWESHRALLRFYKKHMKAPMQRALYPLIVLAVTLGAWARTGRWGESLGKDGGETTPESLHRELEREG